MSPPGRPKGEYRRPQAEGTPVSPLGPGGEGRRAQPEGIPAGAHGGSAEPAPERGDAPGSPAARLTIGLTGGIGSGKSTVAAALVDCGAVLVDTDAIAHALTAPGGAAMPAIEAAFGSEVVAAGGALDRDRMRQIAFGQPDARSRLEAILHPMIGAEAMRQAAAAGGRPVVFDVPLLAASSAWRARVARIVVVDCSEATQVQRVMQRSGWGEAQVHAVIAQQTPRAQRRAIADAVIHNDGLSFEALAAQVRTLWHAWARRR
ncbi:MAG: dephospho-CoA kinase [Burkholderiales bacterium]|nr:dephospho-CoA kinase [Burkholderiales bacterium]